MKKVAQRSPHKYQPGELCPGPSSSKACMLRAAEPHRQLVRGCPPAPAPSSPGPSLVLSRDLWPQRSCGHCPFRAAGEEEGEAERLGRREGQGEPLELQLRRGQQLPPCPEEPGPWPEAAGLRAMCGGSWRSLSSWERLRRATWRGRGTQNKCPNL